MCEQNKFIKKLYDHYSFLNSAFDSKSTEGHHYDDFIISYILNNYSDKGCSICDLGCGTGKKLESLRYLGYSHLFGCDQLCISSEEKSIPELYQKDIIQFLKDNKNKFDVIILNAVLEHFDAWEINIILEDCSRFLNKNGVVITKMPNGASPYGGLYQNGDMTHKTCLNPFSIIQIAKLSGFNSVSNHNEMLATRDYRGIKKLIIRMLHMLSLTNLRIQSIIHFKSNIPLSANFISVLKN